MLKTPYAFIPKRLEVEGRPELENFPFNVMFQSFTEKKDKLISGTALYEPDIESYEIEDKEIQMTYRNKFCHNQFLIIVYNEDKKSYKGYKYIGKDRSYAVGENWQQFFIHFTMIGLLFGEACEFKEVSG